jgi:minor extracellular serine protease Vpr
MSAGTPGSAARKKDTRQMFRGNLRFIACAIVAGFLMAGSGHIAAQTGAPGSEESNELWFVELDSSVDTFRARAKDSGITFTERYVYQRIWKGLSVRASAEAASQMGRLRGVKTVFPVLTVTRGPIEPVSPDLAHALAMTGADAAQSELGLTGTGVKVAVMDTGIDYHHPDLGGGFGPGQRVAKGFDFVGDGYDASGSGGSLIPHPDNDPDDCNGHGTHVAGIIGASGNPATGGVLGVAPDVTFGAYRVFGCDGSTSADIMLAAMERALADGMDVLNMSIGSSFQTWPQYPTAVGADALVEAGMVVVASIGNSGASGVYSAGAPGVGRKVIGVASFDNSHLELPTFTVSPDDRVVGYVQASGAPDAPISGTAALARTGTPTAANDACSVAQPDGTLVSPLPPGSLTGKTALIRRGTCSFYEKSINARAAGAVGVVLYNNVGGYLTPTVAPPSGSPPVTIPVVMILATDGVEINNRIAAGPTSLTWTDDIGTFVNPTGGLISSFSSYGLNAELALKPNIGAPGGLIKSTVPLEAGGYATISGTSMSSPHVAGAVALFLEAHSTATPAVVKAALQNSADPTVWSGNPGLGFNEFVHRQGAGMLDIDDAVQATTRMTPSELSLGEGSSPKTVPLTITNNSGASVSYTLSHQPALATGPMATSTSFAPNAFATFATVTFVPSTVTVGAGSSATVSATISFGATPAPLRVYGGHIVVSGGGSVYRVPYAGITGDYQTIQVLAAGGCASTPFPAIFKRGGETVCATPAAGPVKLDIAVTPQAAGATFNVEEWQDRPVILYHRAHQSRRLEIRALELATNQSHLVAFSDYVSRNANNGVSLVNGGFSTYTWDGKRLVTNATGKTQRVELPTGNYKLQIVVTKALAEANNPAHIETWTSPTIFITRAPILTP